MKLLLVITLFSVFISSGCAARLGRLSDAQRSERLAIEKGRLADIKDPVERTKSYITINSRSGDRRFNPGRTTTVALSTITKVAVS